MTYNDYYPFEDGACKKCPVNIFSERASMRKAMPTRHESSEKVLEDKITRSNSRKCKKWNKTTGILLWLAKR
jgi:hypothetical protein